MQTKSWLASILLLASTMGCGSTETQSAEPPRPIVSTEDADFPRHAALHNGNLYSVEQTDAGLTLTRRTSAAPERPGNLVARLGALAPEGWDFYTDEVGWAVAGYTESSCERTCTITFQLVSSRWEGDSSTVDLHQEDGPADSADGADIVGRTDLGLTVSVPGRLAVADGSRVSSTSTPNLGIPCIVEGRAVFASIVDSTLQFVDAATSDAAIDGSLLASFPFNAPAQSEMLCTSQGILWSTPTGSVAASAGFAGVRKIEADTGIPMAKSISADGRLTRLMSTGAVEVLDRNIWKATDVRLTVPEFPSFDFGGWIDGTSVGACVSGVNASPEIGQAATAPEVSCDSGKLIP